MKTYIVEIDDCGNKRWYLNDKYHCEHGPAIEYSDGTKFWYLNHVEYTEAEWRKQLNKASCVGKVVEVDGVKYKLVKI